LRELDRAAEEFAAAQEKLERERRTRQRDKRLSRVLEGRARVHLLKGELETGYRMLSRAIEYDPGNASARNRLETGTSQR
jgi:predicted NodU family carbamoyl transferase